MSLKKNVSHNIFPDTKKSQKGTQKTKSSRSSNFDMTFIMYIIDHNIGNMLVYSQAEQMIKVVTTIRKDWCKFINSLINIVKLNAEKSQYNTQTLRLLKYYIDKVNDVCLDLLEIGEIKLSLSMLKTTENDLSKLEIEPSILYYKFRVQYNIAHL